MEDVVDFAENALHLRIRADRDADAVARLRTLEVADEDVALAELREDFLGQL